VAGELSRRYPRGDRRDAPPGIVGWLADLSRDTYLKLMDDHYPAWKAKTNPRFAAINREVSRPEMTDAVCLARGAGLWRLTIAGETWG